jgi:hypothetical protein
MEQEQQQERIKNMTPKKSTTQLEGKATPNDDITKERVVIMEMVSSLLKLDLLGKTLTSLGDPEDDITKVHDISSLMDETLDEINK